MIKVVKMTRTQQTSKSTNLSLVDEGYINVKRGVFSLGRKTGNNRRDELTVSIDNVKTAIADYEAAQKGD